MCLTRPRLPLAGDPCAGGAKSWYGLLGEDSSICTDTISKIVLLNNNFSGTLADIWSVFDNMTEIQLGNAKWEGYTPAEPMGSIPSSIFLPSLSVLALQSISFHETTSMLNNFPTRMRQ